MCLMQTDLPGARRPEDHRDLALGQAHVEAAQDLVAAERLVDVDELDGVRHAGRAVDARVPAVLVVALRLGLAHDLRAAAAARRSGRASRAATSAAACALVGAVLGVEPLELLLGRHVVGSAYRLPRPCSPIRSGPSDTTHPPIGARGFAPQKTCVPSIPTRCTSTMLSTIDLAVAVPTPTGPPLAV